jgi:serine/threonine protein kinase
VLEDEQTSLAPLEKDRLIFDIALGLNYLHTEGILHRDFKSANILLDGEGRARIADFGLSKVETGLSTLGQRTEDLQWMAPEILISSDNRAFTKAADVYSFGVVVWEILTGKAPYAGKKLSEISKRITNYEHEEISMDIPEHYQQLLRNCWHKNRWSRPTMSDIVSQLREYQVVNSAQPAAINPLMLQSSAGGHAGFWRPPRQGLGVKGDAPKPEVFFAAAQKFEEQQDFVVAAANYKKASDLGYPRAKTNLALLHLQGKLGPATQKSKETAHQLLLEAAGAKHARAMRSLAYQFETGDGIPKDMSKAKYWYQEAANYGDEYAATKVQELGGARAAVGMRH